MRVILIGCRRRLELAGSAGCDCLGYGLLFRSCWRLSAAKVYQRPIQSWKDHQIGTLEVYASSQLLWRSRAVVGNPLDRAFCAKWMGRVDWTGYDHLLASSGFRYSHAGKEI